VYPTGQVFVWDSAYSAASAGTWNYAAQFTQRPGTGTVKVDAAKAWGGVHNTASGQGTLHDFAAAFLSYKTGSTAKPFTTAASYGAGSGGFYLSGNEDKWNSVATTAWQQAFYLDFSTDAADSSDTLLKLAQDKQSPVPTANFHFRTGRDTLLADDLNGDGFNEREGCYELTCVNNSVYFWFNADSTRTRYYPVFMMNSYGSSIAPTQVIILSQDERVSDTCFASRGDVNISLLPGNRVVFQLNRVFDGPGIIYCGRDPNLAVEMSKFWGSADSGVCKLYWTTESESENKGFRLLRRLTPRCAAVAGKRYQADTAFAPVADFARNKALAGQLTKASRTDYTFADSRVELGFSYEYALEAVDISGHAERYPGTVTLTVDQRFEFALEQNYPNPFNPVTVIKYSVPGTYASFKKIPVRLNIYNIRGQLVKNLVMDDKTPNTYAVLWNGKANNGRLVASGVYLYRVEVSNKFVKTKKMVVVK
jgi:hypothetical protein